jgi:hypothetical protein
MEGRLVPTDVLEVLTAKRRKEAEAKVNNAIMLMCFIIWLTVLILLFTSHSFAQAVEWIGEIGF